MEPDSNSSNKEIKPTVKRSGRTLRVSITAAIILVLGFGGYFGYNAWQKSKVIIPATIKSRINFTIFWPGKAAMVKNDKKTIKFDSSNKLLSYTSSTAGDAQLTISEQATPEIFNDVPQVYTQLIDTSKEYASFASSNGEVYLTHPQNLNGGQSAIMNAKGTLMFVHPTNGTLNETQWKQFFNNLEIVQH